MSDEDYKKALEAQRKAFEAQFGSLESMGFEDKTKTVSSDQEEDEFDYEKVGEEFEDGDGSDSDSDEESEEEPEFQGFDQQPKAVVVKFNDNVRDYKEPTKQELKLLKSGKAYHKQKPVPLQKGKNKSNDTDENLQNDLQLQRFLEESHILSNFQEQNSGAELTLQTINSGDGFIGNARKHTLDSRMKQISSVNAVKQQALEKMPISMRKGMIKSYQSKIQKFEQDAHEGGIILSKVKKGEFRNIGGSTSLTINQRIGQGIKSKLDDKKRTFRQKGLKINSVGRSTRNGLVISQRDIERINGPPGGKGKKKGGKRR